MGLTGSKRVPPPPPPPPVTLDDEGHAYPDNHPYKPGPDGLYRKRQGQILYDTKARAMPHRCNDRVEDVIQALFEGNPLLTVPHTVGLARRCLMSKPGEEPTEAYLFVTPRVAPIVASQAVTEEMISEGGPKASSSSGRGWWGWGKRNA